MTNHPGRPYGNQVFDIIQELRSFWNIGDFNNITDDLTKILLGQQCIDKTNFCRNILVEDHTANSCFD